MPPVGIAVASVELRVRGIGQGLIGSGTRGIQVREVPNAMRPGVVAADDEVAYAPLQRKEHALVVRCRARVDRGNRAEDRSVLGPLQKETAPVLGVARRRAGRSRRHGERQDRAVSETVAVGIANARDVDGRIDHLLGPDLRGIAAQIARRHHPVLAKLPLKVYIPRVCSRHVHIGGIDLVGPARIEPRVHAEV